MSDTVRMEIPKATWTLIAAGPKTDCLVTVSQPVFYAYTISAPSWEAGHSLGAFENMNAAPADGQNFYVLSPHAAAVAFVTAD